MQKQVYMIEGFVDASNLFLPGVLRIATAWPQQCQNWYSAGYDYKLTGRQPINKALTEEQKMATKRKHARLFKFLIDYG
jgi:hypothetical protein